MNSHVASNVLKQLCAHAWIPHKALRESQMSEAHLDLLWVWGLKSSSVVVEFQDLVSFLDQKLVFIVHADHFAAATDFAAAIEGGGSYVSEHLIPWNQLEMTV